MARAARTTGLVDHPRRRTRPTRPPECARHHLCHQRLEKQHLPAPVAAFGDVLKRKPQPRKALLAIPPPQQLVHADRPPVRAVVPTFVGLADAATIGPQLGHPVFDAAPVLIRGIVIRRGVAFRRRVVGRMVRSRDRRLLDRWRGRRRCGRRRNRTSRFGRSRNRRNRPRPNGLGCRRRRLAERRGWQPRRRRCLSGRRHGRPRRWCMQRRIRPRPSRIVRRDNRPRRHRWFGRELREMLRRRLRLDLLDGARPPR